MNIAMPDRSVYRSFQIDTNRINSRGHLANMNRMEKWHRDGVIRLEMSEVAQEEAAAGSNKARREKAYGYLFTMTEAQTAAERDALVEIEEILFPGGALTTNDRNDVEIVFNAMKYRRVLVTADGGSARQPGGILGNARVLATRLDVTVVSDANAVTMVEALIKKRDDLARRVAASTGDALPEWVGHD